MIIARTSLYTYIYNRFIRSNYPKYYKYADYWIDGLTTEQIDYFRKEMFNVIL